MSHLITVEKAYLEMIYRIKLKRIAKGYQSELVSSIICRELGYLRAVEMLQVKIGTEQELQEIAWALGEQEVSAFIPTVRDHTLVNVIMENRIEGNHCIHTCEIITAHQQRIPFFILPEEIEGIPETVQADLFELLTVIPQAVYSVVN